MDINKYNMFCHCVRVASRRERSEAIPETLRLLRFARNDILDLIMTIYLVYFKDYLSTKYLFVYFKAIEKIKRFLMQRWGRA
jgi:hypothetical protein